MKIYTIDDSHNLNDINLGDPQVLQGGTAHFINLKINHDDLYFQLPNGKTKNGITNTKRNKYCDLLYDNNYNITTWINKLENLIINKIDENKKNWFQNEIKKEEIYNMLNPISRNYKSFTIIRTYIDVTKNGLDECILFNDLLEKKNLSLINIDCHIIPLIFIEGIKMTAKSFEIIIKLKQIMEIKNKEKEIVGCLIKTDNQHDIGNIDDTHETNDTTDNNVNIDNIDSIQHTDDVNNYNDSDSDDSDDSDDIDINIDNGNENKNDNENENENRNENCINKDLDNANIIENNNLINTISEINLDYENLNKNNRNNKNIQKNKYNLEEVDIKVCDSLEENINLNNPNQIYIKIYKAARKKAKDIRKQALHAYLDAEKIKNMYLLENIDDSDESYESE